MAQAKLLLRPSYPASTCGTVTLIRKTAISSLHLSCCNSASEGISRRRSTPITVPTWSARQRLHIVVSRLDCCLHHPFGSRHLGFRKLKGGRARNLHDQSFSFAFVANSIPVCLRLIIVTRILCVLEGGVMCKYLMNLTFSRKFEPEGVKALKASLVLR